MVRSSPKSKRVRNEGKVRKRRSLRTGSDPTLWASFEELPQVLSGRNPNRDTISKGWLVNRCVDIKTGHVSLAEASRVLVAPVASKKRILALCPCVCRAVWGSRIFTDTDSL